jgi:hypothetical protein
LKKIKRPRGKDLGSSQVERGLIENLNLLSNRRQTRDSKMTEDANKKRKKVQWRTH